MLSIVVRAIRVRPCQEKHVSGRYFQRCVAIQDRAEKVCQGAQAALSLRRTHHARHSIKRAEKTATWRNYGATRQNVSRNESKWDFTGMEGLRATQLVQE